MTTTILGLDGADWRILDSLLEQGDLPVLRSLIEHGCHGTLFSTVPPNSPPAWASMITGVNPGKHNIFDFTYIDSNYRKLPVDAMARIAAPPLWRIMNRFGLSAGVVNLPIHYPAEPVNGFVICGLVTPWSAEVFTHPPEISCEIGNPGESWLIGQTLAQGGSPEEFLDEILEKTRRQADWIIRLQNEYQPDFLMAVFDGTDKIQHFFWKYWDKNHSRHDPRCSEVLKQAIPAYYRFVDAYLGEVIQARGEGDVFIVSDHGFTGMEQDIFIEKWLLERGYLHLKTQPPAASRVESRTTARSIWKALTPNGTVKKILKQNPLFNSLIGKIKKQVLSGESAAQLNQNVDWSSTRVFFAGVSCQSLQVNLRGRETLGIVEPAECSGLVQEVIAGLTSIVDPKNGRPVIKSAYGKEEIYHGDWTQNSPDVIVIAENGYSLQEGFPDQLVKPSNLFGADRSGGHRPEGMFIACGPNIRKHAPRLEACIIDILPTVLYLNRLPVPNYVDGEVLAQLIREPYLQANPVEQTDMIPVMEPQASEMTAEEQTLLESHLRALGYF